jgi:hypothetical protein
LVSLVCWLSLIFGEIRLTAENEIQTLKTMKNLKYIAVGILVGYLGLYVLELSRIKLGSIARENKN